MKFGNTIKSDSACLRSALRIVHELTKFLRAPAGFGESGGPLDGSLARRELKDTEAAAEDVLTRILRFAYYNVGPRGQTSNQHPNDIDRPKVAGLLALSVCIGDKRSCSMQLGLASRPMLNLELEGRCFLGKVALRD